MTSRTIRLSPQDNVVVAGERLEAGELIEAGRIVCAQPIPAGHKVATAVIARGGTIRKYGERIGIALKDIAAGEHVHEHNMGMGPAWRKYTIGDRLRPAEHLPSGERTTFDGIIRSDGRVGTRNYIAVIAASACAGSVVRFIADTIKKDALGPYKNVDGVVGIVHASGCGLADHGIGIDCLQRTMVGWARHPNFGGVLVVGLGCEINQLDRLIELMAPGLATPLRGLSIQQAGGTPAAVSAGAAAVRELLVHADQARRSRVCASNIVLGLECGGSDGYSGITANPALGAASDLVVANGGAVILSETPEIYGAEHILISRTRSEAVGHKLMDCIAWWESHARRHGIELNNNPSPGNKAGGLTTIMEKSMGAISKAGSSDLAAFYDYAEPVTEKGLVFMNTPGYDIVSLTGMIAGGANVIGFTTGCGSVIGCKPVPTLKLASNTPMYTRMASDMDIDCGGIVGGGLSVAAAGKMIFEALLAAASGKSTKSELMGYGDNEFAPWLLGATL
jgi:altronate hydrolase